MLRLSMNQAGSAVVRSSDGSSKEASLRGSGGMAAVAEEKSSGIEDAPPERTLRSSISRVIDMSVHQVELSSHERVEVVAPFCSVSLSSLSPPRSPF